MHSFKLVVFNGQKFSSAQRFVLICFIYERAVYKWPGDQGSSKKQTTSCVPFIVNKQICLVVHLILNQTNFRLVLNKIENCHAQNHIRFNLKGIGNIILKCRLQSLWCQQARDNKETGDARAPNGGQDARIGKTTPIRRVAVRETVVSLGPIEDSHV